MPQDTLFRFILLVLLADVLLGAVLMLLGHYGYVDPALVDLGAGLGIVGGLLYFLFRWWGRRRQEAAERDRGDA